MEKQVKLNKFAFFVNYANFYVNAIMSTKNTKKRIYMQNWPIIQDVARVFEWITQYIVLQLFLQNLQQG